MDNVTFFEITNPMTNEIVEHVVIDRGNNEFTTMPKATYDEQQAQAEQSTPNLPGGNE